MQALQGERGWRGWNDLQQEKAALQEELAALKSDNAELQKQVKLLGNDNLDLDFLDERRVWCSALSGAMKQLFSKPTRA